MSGPKKVHIDSIGKLFSPQNLQEEIFKQKGVARPLCEVKKKSGDKWTVVWIDPIGVAVASHQTHKMWVIPVNHLIDLASEAGIEDSLKFLTAPDSEVYRGT